MPPHDHRHEGWIKREIRKGGRERERKASFHHPSTVVALPRFATLLGHPARRSKLPRLLGPTPSLLALLLASFRLEQKNRGGEERTSPPSTRRRYGLAASIAVCETAKFEIGREGRKKDPLEANRITVSRIIHAYSLLVCIREPTTTIGPISLLPLSPSYPCLSKGERGTEHVSGEPAYRDRQRERESSLPYNNIILVRGDVYSRCIEKILSIERERERNTERVARARARPPLRGRQCRPRGRT